MDLMGEMQACADASKLDMNGIEQRIQQFIGQLKKTRAQVDKMAADGDVIVSESLSPFLSAAEKQTQALERQLTDAKSTFEDVAKYYGETETTLKKLTPASWFGFASKFAKEFQSIVRDKEDKASREAKRLAKAGKEQGKAATQEKKAEPKKETKVVESRRVSEGAIGESSQLTVKTGGLETSGGAEAALLAKVSALAA
eukprot:Gregarina_sp_Poly_1__2405@NODE_1644_length_3636_cov_14_069207_g1084_i0_p4_GENE_NODE_1644_length_3636_cov_14_069207_g1084_i0NODE_1644_length_3636_cov_14_069207_g1084_i0_p4_ORF_typecomplete_len199_score53_02FH2/PF02181_23/8e16FH2/PF02181_23/3_4e02SRPalpha_N/PF04086_13/0_0033LUC7/PF03194_15/4_3LUC7/PF03194_15/0_19Mesothelin/PF06060_12/0_028PcfK/PF14058_6/0_043T7SS_ESX_EspC/PF10824_8/0_074T7SS_ESX_EspC/PF10824_8/1_1e03T7SS_ESX_EspC/PF10824_8/4_9e03DUF2730/PF10805_8/3_9DUF2730/PF10805_8/4_8e02DUF2730